MRQEKDITVQISRVKNLKIMLEKEKMYEALAVVSRDPDSRAAKKKLKQMQISPVKLLIENTETEEKIHE